LLVEKITDISRTYTLDLSAADLNLQRSSPLEGAKSPFTGVTQVVYRLSRADGKLLLDGEITGKLAMQCSRCLTDVSILIDDAFSMALTLALDENSDAEELELSEDLINSIAVVSGEIDLLPVLSELVLNCVPDHPLCEELCSGLCPHCGVDRNKASCTCEPKPFNNRFGKLINIKVDRS